MINITTTTNETQACDWSYPTPAALALIIISVTIIVENVIGILVIHSTPALHSTANIFVCSMAITDIAAGTACLLSNLFMLSSKFPNLPSNVATYGLNTSLVIFAMVILSCAHMAVIAVERFIYIAHPFFYKKHMSQQTISKVLVFYWIFGALYVSLLFIRYYTNHTTSLCTRDTLDIPELIISFIIYTSSAVISCTVYVRITKVAIRQKRMHIQSQGSLRLDSIRDKRRKTSVSQKDQMLKETMKSIKFFILVFGIFLVFTLPPAILFGIDMLIIPVPNTIFRLGTAPAILNSGVNFLVLASLNSHFKEALKNKLSVFSRRGTKTED